MVKQGVSLGELRETYELLNSKGYQVYTGEFECDKYEAMATFVGIYSMFEWFVKCNHNWSVDSLVSSADIITEYFNYSSLYWKDIYMRHSVDEDAMPTKAVIAQVARQISAIRAQLCHNFGVYRFDFDLTISYELFCYVETWQVLIFTLLYPKKKYSLDDMHFADLLEYTYEVLKGWV